jgi:hypothetical protein
VFAIGDQLEYPPPNRIPEYLERMHAEHSISSNLYKR